MPQGMPRLDPVGPLQQLGGLEAGMRIYREAGGTNAVLANVAVDLADRPELADLAAATDVALVCAPDEARRRLRRMEQLGFDEVLPSRSMASSKSSNGRATCSELSLGGAGRGSNRRTCLYFPVERQILTCRRIPGKVARHRLPDHSLPDRRLRISPDARPTAASSAAGVSSSKAKPVAVPSARVTAVASTTVSASPPTRRITGKAP